MCVLVWVYSACVGVSEEDKQVSDSLALMFSEFVSHHMEVSITELGPLEDNCWPASPVSCLCFLIFLKVCTWMHVEVTGQLQVWALAFHHLLNHLLLSMPGFLALELLGNSPVSSSCCRNTGNICYHAWLYMGAGDPNSGPDDNLPCALPTEPSVQSYFCFQFIYFTHTRGNSLRE